MEDWKQRYYKLDYLYSIGLTENDIVPIGNFAPGSYSGRIFMCLLYTVDQKRQITPETIHKALKLLVCNLGEEMDEYTANGNSLNTVKEYLNYMVDQKLLLKNQNNDSEYLFPFDMTQNNTNEFNKYFNKNFAKKKTQTDMTQHATNDFNKNFGGKNKTCILL